MKTVRRLCLAAVLLAVAACPALAQRGSLAGAAALVPGDVDLLIAVDQGDEWRRGPAGAPVRALLTGLLQNEGAPAAWSRLAQQLGVTEEQAFDLLLGQRLIFATRSSPDAPTSWVLVSTVTKPTEGLLRRTLKPAPRRIQRGVPVMAIEDGRFWLAAVGEGDRSTIILGPDAATALFDEVVAAAPRPAARDGADNPLARLAQADRAARAMLMFRVADEQDRGWVGLTVTPRDHAFEFQTMIDLPGVARDAAAVTPWSRAAHDRAAPGAFLAVSEWSEGAQAGWSALRLLGPLSRLWVQEFEVDARFTGRRMIALYPSEGALAGIAVAFESDDLAALAPAADAAVASALAPFFRSAPGAAQALDFAGEFPEAVRTVDLAPAFTAFRAVFDRGPVASWTYTRHPDGPGGWWTIGLGKDEVARVATELAARPAPGALTPWLSVGSARPAAFFREVERRGLPMPAPVQRVLPALSVVESVEWELFRSAAGSIAGRGVVRLTRHTPRPPSGR